MLFTVGAYAVSYKKTKRSGEKHVEGLSDDPASRKHHSVLRCPYETQMLTLGDWRLSKIMWVNPSRRRTVLSFKATYVIVNSLVGRSKQGWDRHTYPQELGKSSASLTNILEVRSFKRNYNLDQPIPDIRLLQVWLIGLPHVSLFKQRVGHAKAFFGDTNFPGSNYCLININTEPHYPTYEPLGTILS